MLKLYKVKGKKNIKSGRYNQTFNWNIKEWWTYYIAEHHIPFKSGAYSIFLGYYEYCRCKKNYKKGKWDFLVVVNPRLKIFCRTCQQYYKKTSLKINWSDVVYKL